MLKTKRNKMYHRITQSIVLSIKISENSIIQGMLMSYSIINV